MVLKREAEKQEKIVFKWEHAEHRRERAINLLSSHTHDDFGMWLLRRLTLEVKTRAYRDFIVQVQTDQLLRSGVKGQRCWEQDV